jgi:hypothetical protein
LLLAEIYSTQSTNCHLLLKTIDISTFDALKVCVWCILYVTGVYMCISSRHKVQRSNAHLLLAEIYGTQSINCHLLLKTIEISTFDALKVCVWCILHLNASQADTQCKRSNAHLLQAEIYGTQSINCHLLLKTFAISIVMHSKSVFGVSCI